MGRGRVPSKRLRIKKLSDLTINQKYFLRSFFPSMLEIAAPYVIDGWTETFNFCSYAASVCRNWKWLDAKLVSLLLPFPQENCVEACRYMYETSLRVTTFKSIAKEKLENLAVEFDVHISDFTSVHSQVETVYLEEPSDPVQPQSENKLSVLVVYTTTAQNLNDYLYDHMDDLGTKYKVVVFLVSCYCDRMQAFYMDRLTRMYNGLSRELKTLFREERFKWRFWLVHMHRKVILNINDPINWAYGECVATLMENDLPEISPE